MASVISAGTTSGTAIAIAGDTSGALVLQTNGTTTAVTISTAQVVTLAQPLPVASGGTGVTTSTGSGANVLGTSPTLTTPVIDSATVATVSGTAPLYMCRAWVNFNGTGTVAIRASGNVSSITDNGTGDYTVNFTTAMSDANYNVCGSVNGVGGNPLDEVVFAPKTGGTFSTSAVQIFTINPGSGGGGDSTYVSCSIFR
jgi:hypothetical protein